VGSPRAEARGTKRGWSHPVTVEARPSGGLAASNATCAALASTEWAWICRPSAAVAWCPSAPSRAPLLDPALDRRLADLLEIAARGLHGARRRQRGRPRPLPGAPSAELATATLVQRLKGTSARALTACLRRDSGHVWQVGYWPQTVSPRSFAPPTWRTNALTTMTHLLPGSPGNQPPARPKGGLPRSLDATGLLDVPRALARGLGLGGRLVCTCCL
jgi:hypothetical protein